MKAFLKIFSITLVLVSVSSAVCIFASSKNNTSYTREEETAVVPKVEYPQNAEIVVVGDMMFGRNVETLSKSSTTYPFDKVRSLFFESDGAIGNLEGPIPFAHKQTPNNGFGFSFPQYVADLLAQFRFRSVSLANNHTIDQGEIGYEQTANILKEKGVGHFGHPIKVGEISVGEILVGKCEIKFVGLNTTYPSFKREAALSLIRSLKAQRSLGEDSTCINEKIVVLLHWGEEYELHSNEYQRKLAHDLIDSGADLIIGSHPHVVQEVEKYNSAYIFYSLGNFIFDQYFSTDVQQGLALKLSVNESSFAINKISLVPIISAKSQPSIMEGVDQKLFFEKLANRSSMELRDEILSGTISLNPR